MKIVLFDDNHSDLVYLEKLITTWSIERSRSEDMTITRFDNAKKLLFSLPDLNKYDVFFLDIMTSENADAGYRIAESLRVHNLHSAIVFTTNSREYMSDAFELLTYRYLLKPLKKEKVYEALDHLSSIHPRLHRNATVFHGLTNEIIINNDHILFIESNARNHQATIYLINGSKNTIRLDRPFSQLTNAFLPDEFIQCHREIIVNLTHVCKYDADTVYFSTDTNSNTVPIGQKYRSTFINRLIDYYKRIG